MVVFSDFGVCRMCSNEARMPGCLPEVANAILRVPAFVSLFKKIYFVFLNLIKTPCEKKKISPNTGMPKNVELPLPPFKDGQHWRIGR